jgi:hypothetical protein
MNELPVLIVVEDDAEALRRIESALAGRYGNDYAVRSYAVAAEALQGMLTGRDLLEDEGAGAKWLPERHPLNFETGVPRVFAVGDVRANSIKRVASTRPSS